MSHSMQVEGFDKNEIQYGMQTDPLPIIKLPKLENNGVTKKIKAFNKRFHSVRGRENLNVTSQSNLEEEKEADENKIPTSCNSVAEALPFALIKKK